jgi:hypothetical protein
MKIIAAMLRIERMSSSLRVSYLDYSITKKTRPFFDVEHARCPKRHNVAIHDGGGNLSGSARNRRDTLDGIAASHVW